MCTLLELEGALPIDCDYSPEGNIFTVDGMYFDDLRTAIVFAIARANGVDLGHARAACKLLELQ